VFCAIAQDTLKRNYGHFLRYFVFILCCLLVDLVRFSVYLLLCEMTYNVSMETLNAAHSLSWNFPDAAVQYSKTRAFVSKAQLKIFVITQLIHREWTVYRGSHSAADLLTGTQSTGCHAAVVVCLFSVCVRRPPSQPAIRY